MLFAYYEMHHRNMFALCTVFPIRHFLCHHLKSYIYMFKNGIARSANNLTAQICKSSSRDMPNCARIIHGILFFGFSVKTVKVTQWTGQKFVVYGHGIKHGLGFYEIKNCQSFFYILMMQKQPLKFDCH